MAEEVVVDTLVAGENVQPETGADSSKQESTNSEKVETPTVETKDGKLYVDGVRVYTRDDTNKIAANARKDIESRILEDLQVESFDQVKKVVGQLQQNGQEGLDIASLRDAVKKREATVEELKAELAEVKRTSALKEHVSNLQTAMPTSWSAEQKTAVIDLMKSRDMLHLDGDTFAIKHGDSFLTDESGEKPDYSAAVMLMGKTLGLPMSKKGVTTFDADTTVLDAGEKKGVSQDKLKADPRYRNAYVQLRERNKHLARDQITDSMVRKQMEGASAYNYSDRMLTSTPNKTTTRRK